MDEIQDGQCDCPTRTEQDIRTRGRTAQNICASMEIPSPLPNRANCTRCERRLLTVNILDK